MSFLRESLSEMQKTPDLGRELGYLVGLPALCGEQTAHVADEDAEGAGEVTPRPGRRAGARELSERFFHAHLDRPHAEDSR